MAANHISTEKVSAQFFNRGNRRGDISGNIPSDHSVTEKGRRGRRTTDKVKIQDDAQFRGRGWNTLHGGMHIKLPNSELGVSPYTLGFYIRFKWTATGWLRLIKWRDTGAILDWYLVADYANPFSIPTWSVRIADTVLDGGSPKNFQSYFDTTDIIEVAGYVTNGAEQVLWINGTKVHEDLSYTGSFGTPPNNDKFYFDTETDGSGTPQGGSGQNNTIYQISYFTERLTDEDFQRLFRDKRCGKEKVLHCFDDKSDHSSGFKDWSGNNYDGLHAITYNSNAEVENGDSFSILNEKGYNQYFQFSVTEESRLTSKFPIQDWNGGDLITDFTEQGFLCSGMFRTPGTASAKQVIFSNFIDSGSNSGVYIRLDDSGTFEFTIYGENSSGGRTTSTLITSSTWDDDNTHSFVCWADSDGTDATLKVYIDGVLEETKFISNVQHFLWEAVADPFTIGHRLDGGNPIQYFEGEIWDIRLFNAKRYTQNNVDDLISDAESLDSDLYRHWRLLSATESSKDWQSTSGSWLTVPALLSEDSRDVLGSDLFYKNKLAPRLQLGNAPCVKLNGTTQYIKTDEVSLTTSSLKMTARMKISSYGDGGNKHFLSFFNNDERFFTLGHSSTGYLRLVRSEFTNTQINTLSNIKLELDTWCEVGIERLSDTAVVFYCDEQKEIVSGLTAVSNFQTTSDFYLGVFRFGVGNTDAEFCDVKIYDNDVLVLHQPMSEGTGATVYDIIEGNHGAIQNAVLPDIWVNQDKYHYSFYHGFNPYYNWDGSNFVRLNTGWELANDWKVILKDVYIDPSGTFPCTLFSLNAAYYTYVNVDISGEAARLQIGVHSVSEFTNVPVESADLFDGKSHTIEVIKSSTGDGSGNGVKVIFDGADLGWVQALADTTVDNKPQSTRTTIGHYYADSQQNHIGTLGDVEYYDINDNLIKKFTASNGYKDQSGLSPISSSPPSLIKIPSKFYTKDVLDKDLEFRGYADTGRYNGASDIQFPDIPEMLGDLRGKILNQKEVEGLVYAGRLLSSEKDMALFQQKVESIHFQRKGSRLILDDYPATCPSTALQKIQSDFTGNIITVTNEDNLQEADFGFDQYGRLPEADIIEHLNGSANGRVKGYYFQDLDHAGLGYTQSALSAMPYIAKGGVIQKDSRGLPALRFDGSESLEYVSQTAFKSMHDGTRGIQILGFQVDEDQDDFWVIGNSDFQGATGFEFFGDAFNINKLHFIIRTNTATSSIQDLNIPMLMGKYNRVVNYIDPSNQVEAERHAVYVNELLREANTSSQSPNTGDGVDGTTSVGAYATRDMEGFINELIFIGDHKTDMLKFSRSLMFLA